MLINFDNERPIYIQLAEAIEDNILKGIYKEDEQIMSTTEISLNFKINPATAGKGINILVDEGILYKKRGLGMFVSKGAKETILQKRKNYFYQSYVLPLIQESKKLGITYAEIIRMMERADKDE